MGRDFLREIERESSHQLVGFSFLCKSVYSCWHCLLSADRLTVEEGWLSEWPAVWELQTVAASSSRRCNWNPSGPLPYATLHRDWTRRQSGMNKCAWLCNVHNMSVNMCTCWSMLACVRACVRACGVRFPMPRYIETTRRQLDVNVCAC